MNNTFQAKNVRLKAYRDELWKIRDSFMFFELSYIPRAMNHLVDSLVVSASMFIPPFPPKMSYEIQVKYRLSLPDNVKFWKVFENYDEFSKFLIYLDDLNIYSNSHEEHLEHLRRVFLKCR